MPCPTAFEQFQIQCPARARTQDRTACPVHGRVLTAAAQCDSDGWTIAVFRMCTRRHRTASLFRSRISRRLRDPRLRRPQAQSLRRHRTPQSRLAPVPRTATKLLRRMSAGTRPRLQSTIRGAGLSAATQVAQVGASWTPSRAHLAWLSMCLATQARVARVTFSACAARSKLLHHRQEDEVLSTMKQFDQRRAGTCRYCYLCE